ncbi:MAG: N-acetylmuramoyl-L-alanine amidase family protein [bacterium]
MKSNPNHRFSFSLFHFAGYLIIGLVLALMLSGSLNLLLPVSGMCEMINAVVIDPGHGGEDTGCIGLHGTMEKDVNLQLAKRLAEIIQERLGIDAILTRRADYFVAQVQRTGIANHSRADLFISLHSNSTFLPGESGQMMIFVIPELEPEREFERHAANLWDLVQKRVHGESLRLGSLVAEEARKSGLWRKTIIKEAPLLVLKGASMPALLVEVDFLTSSQGEDRLKDKWYQEKISEVLYRAIIRFGFSMEKDPNEAE